MRWPRPMLGLGLSAPRPTSWPGSGVAVSRPTRPRLHQLQQFSGFEVPLTLACSLLARQLQVRRAAGDAAGDAAAAAGSAGRGKAKPAVAKALALLGRLPVDVAKPLEEKPRLSPIAQAAAKQLQPIHPKAEALSTQQTQNSADAMDADPAEVVPDTVPGASEANFSRIYAKEEWGTSARSGLGSQEETTREFRNFLENFLQEHRVSSVVDAGCGHWPSGYQRYMQWQGVQYTGVDVVPYVVKENAAYFEDPISGRLSAFGLSSAHFLCGDVSTRLPPADLLLVKDVLMHLPNRAVHSFLRESVGEGSPYRMVMLVQNAVPPVPIREMVDIEPGQLLPFDITLPPFAAEFTPVFRWKSDEPKVVQVWDRKAFG